MEHTKQEKTLKKIMYIGIPIIILCVIIAIVIWLVQNDKNYKLDEITSFSYFKLYQNEKYGVIDTKGNILVEPKYDNLDIPNPSKPVFIGYFDYDSQKGEYKTETINEKGEKILTQFEKVLPLMFKETTAEVPYEKSVLMYKEGDKYGIINFKGKRITKAEYDSIESLLYKEGCLLVKQGEKYGVITIEGKVMVNTEFDSITADGYYEEQTKYQKAGFIIGKKKEEGYRYGYVNSKGKQLMKVEYNEVDRVTEITEEKATYLLAFQKGQAGIYKDKEQIVKHSYEEIEYNKATELFIVQKESKQGVINKEGKEILGAEYDYVMISGDKINAEKEGILYVFDKNGNKQEDTSNLTILATDNKEYFITINKEEKFGVINKNGNTIIRNEYSYIEYAFDDLFIVTKDGKVGVLDNNKNQRVDFNYSVIQKVKDANILEAITSSNDASIMDLYNSKTEKVLSMENATISVEKDYVKILSKTERKYLDKNGNLVSNKELFNNATLFSFVENGKWGFVDKAGNVKIEPIYDMVTEQNVYGFAGVKKDGKWGVVAEDGKILVEPSYFIEWDEPEFIGVYAKLNFGYGLVYYTNQFEEQ